MSRPASRRMSPLVNIDQFANLNAKSTGELVAIQADINSRRHLYGAASTQLRVEADAIGSIIKSRGKPRFEISDHAVVRWLQKVKCVDIDAVRAEITECVTVAADLTPGVVCRAKGDAVEYVDKEGIAFIVARHNTVVTVHLNERDGSDK